MEIQDLKHGDLGSASGSRIQYCLRTLDLVPEAAGVWELRYMVCAAVVGVSGSISWVAGDPVFTTWRSRTQYVLGERETWDPVAGMWGCRTQWMKCGDPVV